MIPRPSDALRSQDGTSQNWRLAFLVFLALLTGWRLLYLAINPLDLIPDEAYYWDWGRMPALGYYSKPPFIAWINWTTTTILGATAFTVRLPAVIFGFFALVALYGLAGRMFDRRTAFWSVVLAALSPAACAVNFIMTIDAPLVCCWSVALYTSWRAVNDTSRRPLWWLLTAVACGVGILSKQMMLVFMPLIFLFLAVSKYDRPSLKTGWPYLGFVLALSFLLPPIWWNWQNDWITFQHTAHHFESSRTTFSFLRTFFDFTGGQLLLLSPLPVVMLIALSFLLLKQFPSLDRRLKFLLIFSAMPLGGIALLSLRQGINANWPAVFYPAGLVLVAAWVCGVPVFGDRLPGLRRLFPAAVYSGLGLVVLTYALTFFFSFSTLAGGPYDPTARLKGWRFFGHEISTLLAKSPHPERVFLLADKRQPVSAMAFYVDNQPRTYQWNDRGGYIRSQYDLWPDPSEKIGWDSIIVLRDGHQPHPDLAKAFREIIPLTELTVPVGPAGSRRYSVYFGRELLQWPR
ncbi:MAG: glycosyltransferase family 39 protein [Proteobacteria bacterium]|nr:glycosyltransferase family 39 protein [Pseudomonadota bacterium]MBU1714851.1 glycosyltransferase family 39 protein [Pseudomonadota bacterium]